MSESRLELAEAGPCILADILDDCCCRSNTGDRVHRFAGIDNADVEIFIFDFLPVLRHKCLVGAGHLIHLVLPILYKLVS